MENMGGEDALVSKDDMISYSKIRHLIELFLQRRDPMKTYATAQPRLPYLHRSRA